VAPIDLLEGHQVDGLTGGEGGTRAAPGTDVLRQILCPIPSRMVSATARPLDTVLQLSRTLPGHG
jgi:hypothetical protein